MSRFDFFLDKIFRVFFVPVMPPFQSAGALKDVSNLNRKMFSEHEIESKRIKELISICP
jgi:hypothetical protein